MNKWKKTSKQLAEPGLSPVIKDAVKKNEYEELKYSSKIIKAGALLTDTKAFLSCWDPNLSVNENLHRVRHQNLLGKTSRSRIEDYPLYF